ncbi:Hypothetical protein R9X50_00114600 [Acrodontium crateriforme]|uniref:Uncharacterized protein n=1 Tax=Acrodontium crateriforme TaxID=150365 RepID=A0AAQ3M1I6_9PEZI|nr:Hypothetical protein R9X50_00114600 [Acrodontium crateriforme]
MSFGFSPSDVVTLIALCNKAYSGWQNGFAEYTDITDTLDSLLVLLERLDKHFAAAHSNDDNQALNARRIRRAAEREDLNRVLGDCDAVVSELYGLVKRYRSLKTNRRAAWKRFRLGTKDLNGLRTKLTRRITSISAFLLTVELDSIDRVEQNVNDLPDVILRSLPLALGNLIDSRISDARSARGSVMTAYTDDDTQIWKQFCRELRRNGVRSRHIQQHGNELHDFFLSVTSSGGGSMDTIDESPEAPAQASDHSDEASAAADDAQSPESSGENGVDNESEAVPTGIAQSGSEADASSVAEDLEEESSSSDESAEEENNEPSEETTPVSVAEDLPAEESSSDDSDAPEERNNEPSINITTTNVAENLPAEESSSDDSDSPEEHNNEPLVQTSTASVGDDGSKVNIDEAKLGVVDKSANAERSRKDSLLSKHTPLEQQHARPQDAKSQTVEYMVRGATWPDKQPTSGNSQPSVRVTRGHKNGEIFVEKVYTGFASTTTKQTKLSNSRARKANTRYRANSNSSRSGDTSESDSYGEKSDKEHSEEEDPWKIAWHKTPDNLTAAALKSLDEKFPGGSCSRKPQSEASIEAHATAWLPRKQKYPTFLMPEWFTPLSKYDKLYKFQEEHKKSYYGASDLPLINSVLFLTQNNIDIWNIIGLWYLSRYWESLPTSDPGFSGAGYNVPPHGSKVHQTGPRGFYWTYRVPLPLAFKGHTALYQRCPEHILEIWEVEKERMKRKFTQLSKGHPVVPHRAVHCEPTLHVPGGQECCFWYFRNEPLKLLTYSPLSHEESGNEAVRIFLPSGWRMILRKDNGRVEFHDNLDEAFKDRLYNIRSVPPIVEKWAPHTLPPGWAKRITETDRIYWEHIASGLRVAEHPSTHPLIELDPVNGDRIWVTWPINKWRRIEWSNGRYLVPLTNISENYMQSFVTDERRIVPSQLTKNVFWRSSIPLSSGEFDRCRMLDCLCRGILSVCQVDRTKCEEANPGFMDKLREWSVDMASEYDRLVKTNAIKI